MISAQVRDRVGGRWAVSLRLYLVIAPVAIASNVLFVAADPTARGMAATLAASVASFAVMGLVLLLADLTVLRRRRERPVTVLTVALVGVAAGLARSMSAMAFGQVFGLPALSSADIASRLAAGILLGATLIPLGAYLMASIADFRQRRDRLVTERVALQRAVRRDEARVSRLSEAVAAAGVDPDVLIAAASSLEHAVQPDEDLPESARRALVGQRLRELVDGTVRPLSHRLMDAVHEPEPSRLSFRSIAGAAMRQRPFPIAMVLLLWLVSAWPGEWARWGFAASFALFLVLAVITVACFSAGRSMVRRWPAGRFVVFVVVMLAVVALGSAAAWLIVPGMTPEQLVANAIATLVWLPVLTLVTSITATALSQADELVDDLAREVDEAEVTLLALEAQEADQLRALARYLHAEIQPRVLAAAWDAEAGSGTGGTRLAYDIEELARHLRDADLDAHLAGRQVSSLQDVADRWRGLIAVTVGDDRGPLPPRILEAVDEAVANAHRHGRAAHVSVTVLRESGLTDIVIDDDGIGPRGGASGMGSGVYASACGRGWDLSAGADGGSRLVLRA